MDIFEEIRKLRKLGFGIIIGTLGFGDDFSIKIVYFDRPDINFEEYTGPIEIIINKVMAQAESFLSSRS